MSLFKKNSKNKKEEVEDRVKTAEELGYEVGYFGHLEIGWVRKEKKRLLDNQTKLKKDKILRAYEKGKEIGAKKRLVVVDKTKEKKGEKEDDGESGTDTYESWPDAAEIRPATGRPRYTDRPRFTERDRSTERATFNEIPGIFRTYMKKKKRRKSPDKT